MDWRALLALAARHFAITPAAFWPLSLAEWRALTAPAGSRSQHEVGRLLDSAL